MLYRDEDSGEERIASDDDEDSTAGAQATDCEEEPKETWNLGKTLGLSTINEDAVLQTLLETIVECRRGKKKKGKGGQRKKLKHAPRNFGEFLKFL